MQALAMLTQASQPESMTLKDLSEHRGLAQSTVSGIVERLEQKKLVHRFTPLFRFLEISSGFSLFACCHLVAHIVGEGKPRA
jgi:hypothetical protein